MRGPVERAEKRARRHRRVDGPELSAPNAVDDERADASLVPIALGDDGGAVGGRQGIHLEMRGRTLDIIEQTEDVRRRERPETVGQRTGSLARRSERRQQSIERPVLAEEENLVLAAEVVIEVAWRQVCRDGDLAHPGGGVP